MVCQKKTKEKQRNSACYGAGPGKKKYRRLLLVNLCVMPRVPGRYASWAQSVTCVLRHQSVPVFSRVHAQCGGRTVERWDRRHKIINRETRLWRSRTARWKIRETRVFWVVSRLKVTASSCVRSKVPVVPGRLAYGHVPSRGSGCTETEQKTINRETRQPGCRTG